MHLGIERLFLFAKSIKDLSDGTVLCRSFRPGQVLAHSFALRTYTGQSGLLRLQCFIMLTMSVFALGYGPQPLLQFGVRCRSQQPLPHAAKQEPRHQQAIDVVMPTLSSMTLLVQTTSVAE